MTVYVDSMAAPYGRMVMCHMLADTEDELARMALTIGVDAKWWQHKGTHKSHFDICKSKKVLAVAAGAVEVSQKELGRIVVKKRKRPEPLPCNVCGGEPVCDGGFLGEGFTATCGNTDCVDALETDGVKVTRLQALQAWNRRQRSKGNTPHLKKST